LYFAKYHDVNKNSLTELNGWDCKNITPLKAQKSFGDNETTNQKSKMKA